jgi:hypothetical protein
VVAAVATTIVVVVAVVTVVAAVATTIVVVAVAATAAEVVAVGTVVEEDIRWYRYPCRLFANPIQTTPRKPKQQQTQQTSGRVVCSSCVLDTLTYLVHVFFKLKKDF